MMRGSAEWWARADEEDPPEDGPSALERIQFELAAAVPGDVDGDRSWRHIPRRFQKCLKEYVRRPDRLFEAMEDNLDVSD